MLIPNPYFRDSAGKSVTREAVIRILASTGGPVPLPDGSSLPASAIMEPSVPSPQALYEHPAKDIAKTYVGRASKSVSSSNASEELWCVIADISKACSMLTKTQREVIAYKHVYDYTDKSICAVLNITLPQVADAERLGLDKVVAILDNTDDE